MIGEGQIPINGYEMVFEETLEVAADVNEGRAPQLYPIIFKVMMQSTSQTVTIWLLSDQDLYFVYKIHITPEQVQEVCSEYSIKASTVMEFIHIFRLLLQDIHSKELRCCLQLLDKEMLFKTMRHYKGKEFVVLQLTAVPEEEDTVKYFVACRYGLMKERIKKKEEKIMLLREHVRLKNPYLLTYMGNC